MARREHVDGFETDVVTRSCIVRARVSESDDE